MTTNRDRVITIKAEKGTSKFIESWRYNLFRILSNSKYIGTDEFIDYKNNFGNLVVNENIDLLMEGPNIPGYGSKGSNKYYAPVESVLNKLGAVNTIASGIAQVGGSLGGNYNLTWMPWTKGVQAWDGSQQGIKFDYTFNFAMGQYGLWNAKEEVVLPILNLIAPTLPRKINSYTMEGPYPTAAGLVARAITEALPGDGSESGILGKDKDYWNQIKSTASITDIFSESAINVNSSGIREFGGKLGNAFKDIGSYLESLINETYTNYTYTVKFGRMQEFRKMLILDSNASFSNQVDQFGYPIRGSVTLTFLGIIPPSLTFKKDNNVDKTSIKFGLDISKGS